MTGDTGAKWGPPTMSQLAWICHTGSKSLVKSLPLSGPLSFPRGTSPSCPLPALLTDGHLEPRVYLAPIQCIVQSGGGRRWGLGGRCLCFFLLSPLPYLVLAGHLQSKVPPILRSSLQPPPPQFSIPFLVILPSKVTVTTRRGRGQPRHFNFCRKGSGFPPPLK